MGIERRQKYQRFLIGLISLFLLSVNPAHAACTNPSMPDGSVFYNAAQNVPQVCANGNWIALGALNPGAGGGECSGPTMAEGSIFYNDDFDVLQYCDGENWIAVQAAPGGGFEPGYFVLSETAYTGNLGGLSGADSACLTELTTKTWDGKTDAQARNLLTASKVKAFLCDGSTCNNLQADTYYQLARAGTALSTTSIFLTDGNGRGPNNYAMWYDDLAATSDIEYWANRGTVSSAVWATTPSGTATNDHCGNWTIGGGTNGADFGALTNSGPPDAKRWNISNWACNAADVRLMCFVNP